MEGLKIGECYSIKAKNVVLLRHRPRNNRLKKQQLENVLLCNKHRTYIRVFAPQRALLEFFQKDILLQQQLDLYSFFVGWGDAI